jgi:hypothetical protein
LADGFRANNKGSAPPSESSSRAAKVDRSSQQPETNHPMDLLALNHVIVTAIAAGA